MEELRLHLDESHELHNEMHKIAIDQLGGIYLTHGECQALYNWLKNEFVPHNNDYGVIMEVMNKINGKLAG